MSVYLLLFLNECLIVFINLFIFTTEGVVVTIDGKLTHVKNSDSEHFKLVSPSYKYTIEKTTFELQNLFNGNKQLCMYTYSIL